MLASAAPPLQDVIAQAATGSGKTLAYLLPCLHTLLTTAAPTNSPGPRALVLVPTRELCQQARCWCFFVLRFGVPERRPWSDTHTARRSATRRSLWQQLQAA